MLKKIKLNNLIVLAMLAALGVASKVIIGSLVKLFTSSIGIPGGAIAGGFYMMWLAMAIGLTNQRGTATILSIVQALMMFVTGLPGSHGAMTFVTYIIPGIFCDIVFLFVKSNKYNIIHYIIGVALANMAGTFASNLLFFRLPYNFLFFVLSGAALSGAFGGVIAYSIVNKVNSIKNRNSDIDYCNMDDKDD